MGGRSGQSIRIGQQQQQKQQQDRDSLERENESINQEIERIFQRGREILRNPNPTPADRDEYNRLRDKIEPLTNRQTEIIREIDTIDRQSAQQDAESYRDYSARVDTNGTNRFPQYSTGDMISFTGIPKDYGGAITVSYTNEGATIQITGEGVNMTRNVYFDSNGNPDRVYNAYFRIADGSRHDGRGSEIFNSQVNTLKSAGFGRIEVSAAGSARDNSVFNGYYTWARFGYVPDNPQLGVSSYNRYAEQQGYEKVSNFKEIMYTKSGRDWWQNKEGESFRGTFNLQDNSYSMTTLNNYMQERANRNRNR